MVELEMKIVGTMLDGVVSINRKLGTIITAQDFTDKTAQTVFAEAQRCVKTGDGFDSFLCHTRTGIPLETLVRMEMGTPASGQVEAWAKELRKVSKLRLLARYADYIKKHVERATPGQADELCRRVLEQGMKVFSTGDTEGQTLKPMSAVIKSTCEEVRSRYEARVSGGRGDPGLPTGLQDLDNAIGGGIQPGELSLLGGRPSMGKSSVAGNILRRCAMEMQSHCHMLFSLEMGHNQIGRRWIAAQGQVSAQRLRRGDFHGDEDIHKMLHGTKVLNEGLGQHCWVVDKAGVTTSDVRAYLYQVMDATGLPPGLVVVDHLHLMSGDHRKKRGDMFGDISRELLNLARDTGAAILLLVQLNRGLESRDNKRPMMSDIRDSGTLEENANNVFFVYRDAKYNDEADPTDLEFIIAKQRDGFIGSKHLHIDLDTQLVSDKPRGYYDGL